MKHTATALRNIPEKHKVRKNLGLRGQAPWLVTEAGLYRLVMRSNKSEASDFQDWVTDVVLPTIRKTGGFITPEVAQAAIDNPAVFMAKALVMAHESPKTSAARVAVLKPQAAGMDPTLKQDTSIRQLAVELGLQLDHGARVRWGQAAARASVMA